MKNLKGRSVKVAAAAVAVAAVVGGTAVASTRADGGSSRATITVCVGAKLHDLRLVPNSTTRCKKGETLLSWKTSGEKGKDGAGAYEVAVAHGFAGTEEQWLASLRGEQGPAGVDGVDGLDSKDGKDGAAGAAGATGPRGPKGEDGADGEDGLDGPNGVDGEDGEEGASAYEIAVSYGYVGTEAEWLTSLEGADGADGEDGLSAYDIAVGTGYGGTETDWLDSLKGAAGMDGMDGMDGRDGYDGQDGVDGDSAYDIALSNGFVGTQSDWLASLKGQKGDTGATGPAGPVGPQGPAGSPLDSTAIYTITKNLLSTPGGSTSVTRSCYPGDLALSGVWHNPSEQSVVSVNRPIDANTWELLLTGPIGSSAWAGVNCLAVTP